MIVDFGLAGAISSGVSSSAESLFAGTFTYMAPEQAWGHPATASADWYSVGVMLFEVLTGALPFTGSVAEILQAKSRRTIPRPADLVRSVPPALDEVVWKLLDPNPDRRPSAAELLSAIGHVAQDPAAPLESGAPAATCFVGREPELAHLDRLVESVRAGEPMMVHVRGPSGIGKTELLRNFLSGVRANGQAVVLKGGCHPRESVAYTLDSLIDELSCFLVRLPTARCGRWFRARRPLG